MGSTVPNVALSVCSPPGHADFFINITSSGLLVIINGERERARSEVGLRSKRFGQGGPDGLFLTPESGEMTLQPLTWPSYSLGGGGERVCTIRNGQTGGKHHFFSSLVSPKHRSHLKKCREGAVCAARNVAKPALNTVKGMDKAPEERRDPVPVRCPQLKQ